MLATQRHMVHVYMYDKLQSWNIRKGQGTDNKYVCHNEVSPHQGSFP